MNLLSGKYYSKNKEYTIFYLDSMNMKELRIYCGDTIISAYREIKSEDILNGYEAYCYNNTMAEKLFNLINEGIKFSNSKLKCVSEERKQKSIGLVLYRKYILKEKEYEVEKINKELYRCKVSTPDISLELEKSTGEFTHLFDLDLDYIKLTSRQIDIVDKHRPSIRSLKEIGLRKDITWLEDKEYYVVTDDNEADKLIDTLTNYKGYIAFDTETTGLRINMFSKINGRYANTLKLKEKDLSDDEKTRVDKCVGIIFCVEPKVSYYLPCSHLYIRNLYSDGECRERAIKNIKAKYTIGEYRDRDNDISNYWRNVKNEEVTSDCVLMEKCRKILEEGKIVTHNGSFDWKVAYCYDIDTNIVEDTMIMHQLMYKYRRSNSQQGESSSLKYLVKREFNIDQLSLEDFFVGYKEVEDKGKIRSKRSAIDFSYMNYEGTKAYGPADGDMTLSLFLKYKKDMLTNYRDLVYLYGIEILTACAIGYMEFYGHRIDERKIADVREAEELNLLLMESEIRGLANLRSADEEKTYHRLRDFVSRRNSVLGEYNTLCDKLDTMEHSKLYNNINQEKLVQLKDKRDSLIQEVKSLKAEGDYIAKELKDKMRGDINLNSSAQLVDLFYSKLKIPYIGDKPSVSKEALSPLAQETEVVDGKVVPKYPIIALYSKWKYAQSQVTKFFASLTEFMYPGGFIFSSYGQMAAATGRMSCSKPNAQQYSKPVTEIVIPRGNNIFFDADYSQIEYRTLVALANEPELKESFSNPDNDYHTTMAALMYDIPYEQVDKKRRSAAKSFNFGIPYGMGFGSLAYLLHGNRNEESIKDAKEKYDLYFKKQPNVKRYFAKTKESALLKGETKTLYGRVRTYHFKDKDGTINSRARASALRQAGNAVIQGCVGSKTKIKTKEYGIIEIQNVVNKHLYVWDGDKWVEGDVLYSGKKKKCIITFSTGHQFICSPEHKFSVIDYNLDISEISNGKKFVECKNLKKGIIIDCTNDYNKEWNTANKGRDAVILKVESVVITNEYIDMYDVCNTDDGYYVADGIITHNTAADIFKTSVARNWNWIRRNKLYGKVLIVNMVHDEQLLEIDCDCINVLRAFGDIVKNMQFKIESFPPLFIGGGLGFNWKYAKGGDAEIHPDLANQLVLESKSYSLTDKPRDRKLWFDWFDRRVKEFRFNKFVNYIRDESNYGRAIHPTILSLLLTDLKGDEVKGKDETDVEYTERVYNNFCRLNNIEIPFSNFRVLDAPILGESSDTEFIEDTNLYSNLTDEEKTNELRDTNLYGVKLEDIISSFGVYISEPKKILGIDISVINGENKQMISDYLDKCKSSDGLEIHLLDKSGRIRRGGKVQIEKKEIERILGVKAVSV